MADGKLTARQERFVEEYLIDQNATQAAIRAGYKAKAATQCASRLLRFANVAKAVTNRKFAILTAAGVTQKDIVKELTRIGFSEQRGLMTWGPDGVKLRESDELTDDQAAAVAEVSETRTASGGALRLKTHDKVRALELLGRHLGVFSDGPAVVLNTTGAVTVYVPANGRDG